MTDIATIGILGYPNCGEQDTVTPLEMLKFTSWVVGQTFDPLPVPGPAKKLDVQLVVQNPGTITMQTGVKVEPDAVLKGDELFDMLYVPGGHGSGAQTQNQFVLDLIKRHYDAGKVVVGNCTGVGILYRAGILGDNPISASSAIGDRLRQLGANLGVPRRQWIGLPDLRLWTMAGAFVVDAGTAALIAHYFGHDVGLTVLAGFDTLGGIGQNGFELVGPEMYTYPDIEAKINDYSWKDLLP